MMCSGQGSRGRDAYEPLEMPSGARSVKPVVTAWGLSATAGVL